jgi:hypothetical protein
LLDLGDTGCQDAGNLRGDLVLQRKEIGDRFVEPRGPEDLAFGIDGYVLGPGPDFLLLGVQQP